MSSEKCTCDVRDIMRRALDGEAHQCNEAPSTGATADYALNDTDALTRSITAALGARDTTYTNDLYS